MKKKALLLAFITIIIWASSFAAIRASLLGGYSAGHLVLMRFFIASIIFIMYFAFARRKIKLPPTQDLLKITLLGWIGISVYHIFLTFGQVTVTASTASMIVGAAPIFTAIIAFLFFKERLNLISWIGLVIGFVGITFVTVGAEEASFSFTSGVFYVVVATIATSVFFVFQQPLLKKYHPIELTALFTWAGLLPMLIFLPGFFETLSNATVTAHLSAIYVGIFPAAIAYVIWSIALSIEKASTVASMLYIEPAFAVLIAWVWLNEWPSTLSLIGGIVAILGVVLVSAVKKR